MSGEFQLIPRGASTGWHYTVDFDDDGPADREGILTRGIGFLFSFEEPGIHRIPVLFERGDERFQVDALIGVNDPASSEVLAEVMLPQNGSATYEGLVMDHAGTALYAGDFRANHIVRVSADLREVSAPLGVDPGPEGMAISPSDSLLYVIHKRGPLTVIAIPDMEVRREFDVGFGFFVSVIEEFSVLVSGSTFGVFDTRNGQTIASSLDRPRHAVFSSSRNEVVALTHVEDRVELVFYALPDLSRTGVIPIEDENFPNILALGPNGDVIYVFATNLDQGSLLVFDRSSGDLLRRVVLTDVRTCGGFCVANPSAISEDGRTLAFESQPANVFVDTGLGMAFHQPTDRLLFGSVAASPTEPGVFYVLRSDGLLTKLRIRSPD